MSNIDKRALREAAEKASTDNHTQDEWFHYLRCSTPETVLALLDELEAKDRRNAELNSTLERWATDRAQSASELDDAEKRVAELEAREVTLPQRQEPTSSGHYGESYLVPSNADSALNYDDTVEALTSAGIRINGED